MSYSFFFLRRHLVSFCRSHCYLLQVDISFPFVFFIATCFPSTVIFPFRIFIAICFTSTFIFFLHVLSPSILRRHSFSFFPPFYCYLFTFTFCFFVHSCSLLFDIQCILRVFIATFVQPSSLSFARLSLLFYVHRHSPCARFISTCVTFTIIFFLRLL